MAVVQPSLGGATNYFPWPQQDGGYRVRYEYRGGTSVMANGSVLFDLVASGSKRVITLTWVNINSTDRDLVMTRLSSLGMSSATLVTPENASITVTLDENMTLPDWVALGVPDGAGAQVLRYSGSVTLREV